MTCKLWRKEVHNVGIRFLRMYVQIIRHFVPSVD